MTILLKDIFNFEALLENHKGKRIKLRFNTNWKYKEFLFDYVDMCKEKEERFVPLMLTMGNTTRNLICDIQFQFIEVEVHKWLFVGAYDIMTPDSLSYSLPDGTFIDNYAEANKLSEYDIFVERLIVEFKNRAQRFFYVRDDIINSVKVDSILSKTYFESDIKFPGYENLCKSYHNLKQHWNNKSWIQALSEVYGVYLITDKKQEDYMLALQQDKMVYMGDGMPIFLMDMIEMKKKIVNIRILN